MAEYLPRAMLLDMDDTILVDSAKADDCWRAVLHRFASRLSGLAPEALFAAIQDYRDWFWSDPERHRRGRLDLDAARQEIVAAALLRLGIDTPTLAGKMARAYSAQREDAMRPFPGAIKTLHWLRGRGVGLALLTNGAADPQRRKIEKWGLAPFFDCIVVEGEFGVGKPDERVYRHALAQLGVTPVEAWMVGDNLEWDVAAPQQLGMSGIWVDFAGTGLPAFSPVRPDRIIRTLSELQRWGLSPGNGAGPT